MTWTLHFLGVGDARARELGNAAVMIERDGAPMLMVDCGPEAIAACIAQYGGPPPALFITHTHLDHVGGMEQLFGAVWFDPARRGQLPIYVPTTVVPLLQRRIAEYPDVLAEGGVNFWDAFRLVPVGSGFWHAGWWFEVFPVRHHLPDSAFGLALRGSFVYTGDTRPIPEVLASVGEGHEPVAHDCGLQGNPSHSGIEDIERDYPPGLRARLVLYHYASEADGDALAARGYRVARRGMRLALAEPTARRAVGA